MAEHTSKQFDVELEAVRTRVLQMGGLVEEQIRRAIDCALTPATWRRSSASRRTTTG